MAENRASGGLFEIQDPELDVDEITRQVRARARERRRVTLQPELSASLEGEAASDLRPLQENWDPEGALPPRTRVRWLKRLLFWVLRPFSRTQTNFNSGVLWALTKEMDRTASLRAAMEALDTFAARAAEQGDLQDQLIQKLEAAQRHLGERATACEELQQQAAGRLDALGTELEAQFAALSAALQEAATQTAVETAGLRADLVAAEDRITRHEETVQQELRNERLCLERAIGNLQSGPVGDVAPRAVLPTKFLTDHVFASLDRSFRGSKEVLRQKFALYVPILASARARLGGGEVLDIGCGRGILLEMLREAGIPARGVETNLDMVHLCQEKELDVVEAEGLAYLAAQPDATLAGVVALHVVEHLPFPEVMALVRLAREKLRPGGVLIVETPNPRNLIVSTAEFYMDISHRNPIHPLALSHLATALGFTEVRTEELSPAPSEAHLRLTSAATADLEAENENWRRLNDMLFGPRDYAIIATR